MNNIIYRLVCLLLGWGTVGIIYESTAWLQGEATVLYPSAIDQFIRFSPHAIWPYLSFFIIIPLSFSYAPLSRVRWMCLSFILTSVITGIIYLVFPTTMITPVDHETSLSSQLLKHLIAVDTPNHCLPSLHVALTLIVVWGYIRTKRVLTSGLFILWGIAICFSILQLKRHLFIDLVTGALLAIIVGICTQYFLDKTSLFLKINKNKEI